MVLYKFLGPKFICFEILYNLYSSSTFVTFTLHLEIKSGLYLPTETLLYIEYIIKQYNLTYVIFN